MQVLFYFINIIYNHILQYLKIYNNIHIIGMQFFYIFITKKKSWDTGVEGQYKDKYIY